MSPRHGISLALLLCPMVMAGCTFDVQPAASAFGSDAGVEYGGIEGSGAVSGSGGAFDGKGGEQGSGAVGGLGGDSDGSTSSGSGGSSDPSSPGGAADAGGACVAPSVAGCDPVKNEGCAVELGMQCAADLLAPSLTGFCTFSAPMDAGACLNTGVTESCPPTTTCVDGACRALCFCDADCEGGCCVQPVGSVGFKVCGDC